MILRDPTPALMFVTAGIYLVVVGVTAKFLINESDVIATEEEKQSAAATPLKRVAVVSAGLASAPYDFWMLFKYGF